MTADLSTAALLARIGLAQFPAQTAAGLRSATRAFRRAIPFENLDALAECALSTDLAPIFEKIVRQGRGGWCYELNQLFAELLRRAGFEVRLLLARVGYRRPGPGPLTHLLLQVEVGGRQWLLDVGFGGPGPLEPVLLADGESTDGDGTRFDLRRGAGDVLHLRRWIDDEWVPLYEVMPIAVLPADVAMASHFLSTWPPSPFRRQFMCAAYDGESHWSLEGDELLRRDAQWRIVERTPLQDDGHLQSVLEAHFGIRAPTALVQAAWRRTRQ